MYYADVNNRTTHASLQVHAPTAQQRGMDICKAVYTHLHIYTETRVPIYTHAHIRIHKYTHTYISMCIYTHTQIDQITIL